MGAKLSSDKNAALLALKALREKIMDIAVSEAEIEQIINEILSKLDSNSKVIINAGANAASVFEEKIMAAHLQHLQILVQKDDAMSEADFEINCGDLLIEKSRETIQNEIREIIEKLN